MEFSKIELQLKKFKPFIPLATGHSQTVLGHIMPSPVLSLKLTEHILTLPDGDELLLECYDNSSKYTLSIYHGLAGHSQADYMHRSAAIALELGWNIVLVNQRGASSKVKARLTYHSGRGADASEVIKWARHHFANSQQVALGFSMSGSILLNLVAKRSGDTQPDFAIVVNAPLNLARSAKLLTKGFSKIYDYRFYLMLKKLIQQKESLKMPILATTYDIDQIYTSKVNGFKDANDYYEKCSTLNYLNQIETKTFVLSAHDDPFVDINDYLMANWNHNTHVSLQNYGGHMGYYSLNKETKYGRRWLDHYLATVFTKIQNF